MLYELYFTLLAMLDCIHGAKLLQVFLKLFSLQIQTSTVLVKRRFGSGEMASCLGPEDGTACLVPNGP